MHGFARHAQRLFASCSHPLHPPCCCPAEHNSFTLAASFASRAQNASHAEFRALNAKRFSSKHPWRPSRRACNINLLTLMWCFVQYCKICMRIFEGNVIRQSPSDIHMWMSSNVVHHLARFPSLLLHWAKRVAIHYCWSDLTRLPDK